MRGPEYLKMEVGKPASIGPESNPWFWNPGLFGVKLAPEDFRSKVHAISPDLEVTWNPETSRWQVFCKAPHVTHPISRGWRLLFIVQDEKREFVPLDERTLCKIWAIDGAKVGSSKQYFDAIEREIRHERELLDKRVAQEDLDGAGEYFDYAYKPKVGYGAISQSKVIGQ
jgi:hypothetical protein